MNRTQIQQLQSRVGTTPDSFWGPKSIAACQAHLRSLMPSPNPWPKPDQARLRAYYGAPGDESNLVTIEFSYPMFYEGKLCRTTRVHKRCADSLLRVLTAIGRGFGSNQDIMDEADDYGGLFNFRLKQGGTSYSLHAYGAAIDLDADDNGFYDHWPMKADMDIEIMECFAREGWKSAGAFWGYDAMHHEATS